MNNFLIRAFVKSLKYQKNGNKNKTNKQRESDNIQRIEIPTTPNGNRKSMYRSIFKRLWG